MCASHCDCKKRDVLIRILASFLSVLDMRSLFRLESRAASFVFIPCSTGGISDGSETLGSCREASQGQTHPPTESWYSSRCQGQRQPRRQQGRGRRARAVCYDRESRSGAVESVHCHSGPVRWGTTVGYPGSLRRALTPEYIHTVRGDSLSYNRIESLRSPSASLHSPAAR
jgi:hypothetical protein